MQYELKIPEENRLPHFDIEKDIEKRGNGMMTFVLRVHEGKITDYSLMETVDAKTKYVQIAKIAWEELTVSCNYRK